MPQTDGLSILRPANEALALNTLVMATTWPVLILNLVEQSVEWSSVCPGGKNNNKKCRYAEKTSQAQNDEDIITQCLWGEKKVKHKVESVLPFSKMAKKINHKVLADASAVSP